MFERSRPAGPAWGCAAVAVVGIFFCLANALGKAEAICFTAGCSLFSDVTFAGISLWWVGLICFSLLLLVALPGWRRLGTALSATMLTGDLFFLALMAFTAPCVPCLSVAALFALQFFCFSRSTGRHSRGSVTLLVVWAVFFSPNVFASANEMLGVWAINMEEATDMGDMQVYFSPSCPACKKAVESLARDVDANYAFFPVAEEELDEDRIWQMQQALETGASFYVAFKRGLRIDAPQTISFSERIGLKWQLFRNKVRLATMGANRIPVLVTNGVPKALLSSHSSIQSPPSASDHVPGLSGFAGCSQDDPLADCD